MLITIALLLFFFSTSTHAQDLEQKLEKVAFSKAWLRLLHYDKKEGNFKSQLDGGGFFFAPNGKTNPLAELKASMQGFKQANKTIGHLKLHPQCAFPERWRFIRSQFSLDYPRIQCPLYERFVKRYHQPVGISLVFSSAYPNNPASMFGHTFLKIRSRRQNELLDLGVNFAAHTPSDYNMLEFMYKGVVGGYPGIWSMEPYFKKVNEYINAESRDLWEYELNLTEEETLRVLSHLWELEVTSHLDYFFFDENCSYQVLKAIEAVRLDWNVSRHRIYVIPGETIKRVMEQPGAVKRIRFRPSLFHQTQIQLANLDETGRKSALDWMNQKVSTDRRPEVLSVALKGLLYKRAKSKLSWTASEQDWENTVLALQATSPQPSKTKMRIPKHLNKTRPDLGHHPYSFHVTSAWQRMDSSASSMIGRIKIRSAYHDLLSPDAGFSPFTQIEGPLLEVQFNESQNKIEIDKIGILNTISIYPLLSFDKRKSWRVKLSLERERILPCQHCLLPKAEAGIGLALGELDYRFYTLGLATGEVHQKLSRGYRLRPGVEWGFLWNPMDKYKMKLEYRHLWGTRQGTQVTEGAFNHSFHLARNSELRQSIKILRSYPEGQRTSEINLEWIQYFR